MLSGNAGPGHFELVTSKNDTVLSRAQCCHLAWGYILWKYEFLLVRFPYCSLHCVKSIDRLAPIFCSVRALKIEIIVNPAYTFYHIYVLVDVFFIYIF